MRKLNVFRTAIVAYVVRAAGSRNCIHSTVLNDPSQRYLGRGCMVAIADGLKGYVVKQSALFDRRIRHDGNATLLTPRQQVPLDAATR